MWSLLVMWRWKSHQQILQQEPKKYKVGKLSETTTGGQEVVSEGNQVKSHHCQGCGKLETVNSKFMQCKKCKSVRYCSRKCQKNGWPSHQKLCEAIHQLSQPVVRSGKGDSEDDRVYVSHLTPGQHQKVVKLVGRRCTVDCTLNGKTAEVLWDTGAQLFKFKFKFKFNLFSHKLQVYNIENI